MAESSPVAPVIWRCVQVGVMLGVAVHAAVNDGVKLFHASAKRDSRDGPWVAGLAFMLRLHTLGELRLEDALGRTVLRRRKPLVLLTYLCRRAPRAVPRGELVELLWGERAESKARQSLRQALLELRQHVGDALIIAPESVALPEGAVEWDLAVFERDEVERRDRAAVDQWRGEFLTAAEFDADLSLATWIESERVALRRRLGLCFDRLLEAAERRGDWHEAIALAERWGEAAPLDERAATRLVGALRSAGRHGAAISAHATFVARLREGADAAPSAAFTALGTSIDDEARDNPADRDAAPLALRFVGRGEAYAALKDAWRGATHGRATVALVEGGAGMGASRLCAELAAAIAGAHRDALVLRIECRGRAPNAPAPAWSAARTLLTPLARSAALGGVAPATLRVLGTVLPEIATRFPRLDVQDAPVSEDALAAALGEALLAVAEDGPVLIVADALSHADAPSRALVLGVVAAAAAPILLVVADRGADVDDEPSLAALRDAPGTIRVPLGALDAAAVASVVDGHADLVCRVRADTGGVPAYVVAHLEQMLADHVATIGASGSLALSPAADGRPLGVPAAARALVRDVARPLGGGARAMLAALGTFGAPLALADAATLTGLSPADGDRAASLLIRSGLARRVGGTDDRIALDPPIVARAAYELVPVLERERLHAESRALLASRRGRAYDRSRLKYHEDHARVALAPARPAWRSRSALTLAAMLVVAGAAWAFALRPRAAATARQRTVAVFPFTVRGNPELSFLQSGMVSLLSTSLDGAAGLRTLDPRTVLAAGALPNDMTPDAARGRARRLGASLFVVGDAVDANKQLALTVSLYSTNGGAPLASARAEGREDDLFGLVDRVSAELAVSQGSTSRGPAMQLGALTTSSLPALKAYLEGEAAYRDNDMFAAKAAFERATEADSTFSLAWYGQAATASWMLMSKAERDAADHAVRTSGRLSERNRLLITAFAAFSRGDADSAERLASDVAERYDDVEAWVILGEVLYHHNWKRGRSLVESRRAFERVLALDPHHWPALQHLAEVAAIEGKPAEADSLLRRYEALVGPEHTLPPADAFRRFAYGTARERAEFIARMKDDRGFWLISSIFYVAVYARDLDGARALARELVDPVRPPEQRGFGQVMLAHLDLAGGRWRDARADLALATAYAPLDAVEHEALLALAPLVDEEPGAREARQRLRAQLQSAPPSPPAELPWRLTDEALQPMLRAYLMGLLGARDGDAAAVAAALQALDTLPDPSGAIDMRSGLRFAVRGEVARSAGTPAAALAAFEHSARHTPYVTAWTSAFVSQAHERYARAELLHQLGRDEEALGWYRTFDQNSPYDLVYVGPASYRQGQILEAHGRPAEAAVQYRRFVTLWHDCDPELKRFTDDAAHRLAALRFDTVHR
ncbi:MAG TPA: BTAD domain-containing putative transcriptional regulator [Gemmatimonadaceae bacterium]|nr:BTAD domain-containing putative transcriptional regulator [Gemmatimonadaceae bacterium]